VAAVRHSMETDAPIDMIFMDQVMPNMTGMEATRIIREMGYDGGIIAVTGNVLEEDMQSVLAAGTDEIVIKPLKVPHLEKIIQSKWPAANVMIDLMLVSQSTSWCRSTRGARHLHEGLCRTELQ
jgi:CheY-like chemotaxis protein